MAAGMFSRRGAAPREFATAGRIGWNPERG